VSSIELDDAEIEQIQRELNAAKARMKRAEDIIYAKTFKRGVEAHGKQDAE